MKLHKLAMAALTVILFGACGITISGSDGSGVSGGITVHGYPILHSMNVTDTSACSYGPSGGSLYGRWEVDRRSGAFTSHLVYDFHPGGVTITNHCEYGAQWLHSSIGVSTTDLGSSVRFNNSAEHTEYGYGMDCRAKADFGTYRYWFNGSCLVLNDDFGGETITLVPARFYH